MKTWTIEYYTTTGGAIARRMGVTIDKADAGWLRIGYAAPALSLDTVYRTITWDRIVRLTAE